MKHFHWLTPIGLLLAATLFASPVKAQPDCMAAAGENLLSWPDDNPVWELCWLRPADSAAARGSSLEIRDVHYMGRLVLKQAHSPMLFAYYQTGLCYRDWKDTQSQFLANNQTIPGLLAEPTEPALTHCDVSTDPNVPVFDCPYEDVTQPGNQSVGDPADCFNGVAIERYEDHVLLTTNHSAAWYKYSSRFKLYMDGRIEPEFGFGNNNGTNGSITHWHHNYWRFDFDINGADNDQIAADGVLQPTEFTDLRDSRGGAGGGPVTWEVSDTVTGLGYRITPSAADYVTPTDESGSGFHITDFMATAYRTVGAIPEYSDTPGSNSLGNCSMNEGALVNGASIADTDVVVYYRASVQDLGGSGMVCKKAGPILEPIGNWAVLFGNGFE